MTITLEQIIITGIHLGHLTQCWNPKIAAYIYGVRNGSHLIDLVITRTQLKIAQHFLVQIRGEGRSVLFVGNELHTKQIVKERALVSKCFFVKGRWLGGILTNLPTIQTSLLQLHRLEQEKKNGLWRNLTKKNVTLLRKKLQRKQQLKGLQGMKSVPGIVVILTQKRNNIAIQECKKIQIPTICLLDTDCDPSIVNIGIPINDDSGARIQLFLETILLSIYEGHRWWLSKKVKQQTKIYKRTFKKRTRLARTGYFFEIYSYYKPE
uniref:Small ribosomal subunit protein uS2c n=1 Tax=Lepidodinium chlorophorum TaxID=107758 RepID=A0A0F7QZS1_LEPCH|nr:ribosomal protein S2 [Lepidodinium chlorophorum]BAR72331.1 ribosomal protein S2 [Lepidodinium chlorophorum]